MVTFGSEDAAKCALVNVATTEDALATAESGWVTTHCGLYARYLQEADLEQSCTLLSLSVCFSLSYNRLEKLTMAFLCSV